MRPFRFLLPALFLLVLGSMTVETAGALPHPPPMLIGFHGGPNFSSLSLSDHGLLSSEGKTSLAVGPCKTFGELTYRPGLSPVLKPSLAGVYRGTNEALALALGVWP